MHCSKGEGGWLFHLAFGPGGELLPGGECGGAGLALLAGLLTPPPPPPPPPGIESTISLNCLDCVPSIGAYQALVYLASVQHALRERATR